MLQRKAVCKRLASSPHSPLQLLKDHTSAHIKGFLHHATAKAAYDVAEDVSKNAMWYAINAAKEAESAAGDEGDGRCYGCSGPIYHPDSQAYQRTQAYHPESYTQGVYLLDRTSWLQDFSPAAASDPKNPIYVGFIDVEGSGDKTGHYDLVLTTPILMSSKVVFFNWMGARCTFS